MQKQWYKSKTKVGAALIGLSAIIGTIGGYLSGNIELGEAFRVFLLEGGAILGIMGLRDLPIINKSK